MLISVVQLFSASWYLLYYIKKSLFLFTCSHFPNFLNLGDVIIHWCFSVICNLFLILFRFLIRILFIFIYNSAFLLLIISYVSYIWIFLILIRFVIYFEPSSWILLLLFIYSTLKLIDQVCCNSKKVMPLKLKFWRDIASVPTHSLKA